MCDRNSLHCGKNILPFVQGKSIYITYIYIYMHIDVGVVQRAELIEQRKSMTIPLENEIGSLK